MRLITFIIVFISTLYLCYGLIISRVEIKPKQITNDQFSTISNYYDYKGVVNVHSKAGDGQGTTPEILKAAYEAKLDFIIFTENSSFNEPIAANRYEENILVLNGREYSYLKSRLILIDSAFDFSQIKNAGDAHLFLSDYLEKNRDGYVILKHPTRKGYEWEGDFAKGIDAVEIISLRSHWRESWDQSKWSFIISLLMYPFNPDYAFLNIYQIPRKNLSLWYKIAKNRKIVGLIGSDAKSKFKFIGHKYLRFPSYKQLFQISTNHIILKSELTGQLKKDSDKILTALINGQFYFSLDFLGDPEGFNFYASEANEQLMGTSLTNTKGNLCYTLPRLLPKDSWAKIYHNGKSILDSRDSKNKCITTTEAGAYNLILYRKIRRPWPLHSLKVPWVYSNFIYIK